MKLAMLWLLLSTAIISGNGIACAANDPATQPEGAVLTALGSVDLVPDQTHINYNIEELLEYLASHSAVPINIEVVRGPDDPPLIFVPCKSITQGKRQIGDVLNEICKASPLASYTCTKSSVTVKVTTSKSIPNSFSEVLTASGSGSKRQGAWLAWISAHNTNIWLQGGATYSGQPPIIGDDDVSETLAVGSTIDHALDTIATGYHARWSAVAYVDKYFVKSNADKPTWRVTVYFMALSGGVGK